MYRWPDEGQSTETCRQDKNKIKYMYINQQDAQNSCD